MLKNLKKFNLPEIEEKVSKFWQTNQIFQKTLQKTKHGQPFVFYEGPPYANGLPGIHHFLARVFKDIIIRYRTMRGFFVPRKAGWDTHGLPIEMEVEKKLGVKTKKDIEDKIGIARFVKEARKSVFFYKDEWEKFTERIGYWLDLKNAYMTMSTEYIESLWWIIKEIWKKGLLYQDFKVLPWCPRCQTALSTHELGLGYETVKDRAVYVRFQIKTKAKDWQKAAILSWTTTPWTLPGNVALAVNQNEEYVRVSDPELKDHWLVLSAKSFQRIFGKKPTAKPFRGKVLLGLEYEPLFPVPELQSKNSYKVYAADFVTTEEGTGVVHTAVMYGEDDYQLGKKAGLPRFHTVTETGRFIDYLGEGLGGLPVKDPKTEEKIIASIKRRGLLFKEELYEHEYPFCWRCETPLLYYAREGWWVKVSAIKKNLLRNNETINWIPAHIKRGRFGEFLKEGRDWAFSRERYWGTPLPVWQCAKCRHREIIGSLKDLGRLAQASNNRYFALRHGQSETQLLGIADDDPKAFHLTPRGQRAVREAAQKLKNLKIDLIVASPVARAWETAKIVSEELGQLPIVKEERLREIHVGIFEHQPTSVYHRYFSSIFEKFMKRPPQGESLVDLKKRVMAAISDLESKHQRKNILLVSHEYPIWILWGAVQGLTNEELAAAKEKKKDDFLLTAAILKIPYRPLPRDEQGEVNLHRPFVDEFKLICQKCRGEMKRVPDVVDVWFDSGSMPWAQYHYPFEHKNDLLYPADYICEAVDQTRGWFYTLLAVATLLGRKASYKNVISLGHVLDKNGQKMSKSKGNVVDPWQMIGKYGTDAIRWYFYTVNQPGEPKRFDEADLGKALRKFILLLYNSYVFFETYGKRISGKMPSGRELNVLDRWILARLQETIAGVSDKLERYDIVSSARTLEDLVDDLSHWYIRRSRRRFSAVAKGYGGQAAVKDYLAASQTLHYVLQEASKLLAPFVPFFAEALYQSLNREKLSVHLADWPKANKSFFNQKLIEAMAEVRKLASLALAKRAAAGVKVRQPLAKLKVKSSKFKIDKELSDVLKGEVNVKEIIFDGKIKDEVELDTKITPELKEEGILRELVRLIQDLRQDAGCQPKDKIFLAVETTGGLKQLLMKNETFLKQETGAKEIEYKKTEKFDAEINSKIDDWPIWLSVRKI